MSPPPPKPAPAAETGPLQPALRGAVEALQASLARLLDGLGLDSGRPQSVARALEIDKTLAWRACRFCRAPEVLDALGHLPGEAALTILVQAGERRGASQDQLADARAAAAALQAQVVRHAGSRQGLRRLVASLDAERETPRLQEDGRRQAFHGNAAIWGLQAQARLGLSVLAPAASDPSRLDVISVGGLHGLHRMRESARWPIVRLTAYDTGGPRPGVPEPLDPDVRPGEPPLLRRFCSERLPTLRQVESGDATLFELDDGELGRTGAVTCLFGLLRRSDRPRTPLVPDDLAEHLTLFNTPVERGLCDLALHRDLDVSTPELMLCSLMESTGPIGNDPSSRYVLPVAERVVELTGSHPVLETPCLPGYRALVEDTLGRLGHVLADYRFFRVEFSYPPIPTVAVLRHTFESH